MAVKTKKNLTLEDIALKSGVSTSTVSRVLNNEPRISSKTRQRVMKIADEHGFSMQKRKRPIARSQLCLNIVVPDESDIAENPFFNVSELLASINNAFSDEKKKVEIISISDYKNQVKGGDISRADGTILAFSAIDNDVRDYLVNNGVPYVFLNRIMEEDNYISCNNCKGMIKLGSYLSERGHSRIGYLGFSGHPVNSERYRGYCIASFENSGTVSKELARQVSSIEDIDMKTAEFFIKNRCDAVMCFNDNFAIRLINEFQLAGKKIPEDISITGFDNSPMRRLFKPEITTIDLSTYDMGFFAARWLRDNIYNRENRAIRMEVDGNLLIGNTVR